MTELRELSKTELAELWVKISPLVDQSVKSQVEAELVAREKGGPGSGWFAPPKGTHVAGSQGGAEGKPWHGAGTPGDMSQQEDKRLSDFFSETVSQGGWRDATGPERGAVKHALVTELSETADVPYDLANKTIRQWSIMPASAYSDMLSIQEAVSEEFDVPMSDFHKRHLASLRARNGHSLTDRPTERRMVRAMYDNTQRHLQGLGFKRGDTVRLYRGMALSNEVAGKWEVGDTVGVIGNAAESWSIGMDIAHMVTGWSSGDRRVVMSMDVPVEMIMGTSKTGWGALMEGEVIVLGSESGSRARVMVIDE